MVTPPASCCLSAKKPFRSKTQKGKQTKLKVQQESTPAPPPPSPDVPKQGRERAMSDISTHSILFRESGCELDGPSDDENVRGTKRTNPEEAEKAMDIDSEPHGDSHPSSTAKMQPDNLSTSNSASEATSSVKKSGSKQTATAPSSEASQVQDNEQDTNGDEAEGANPDDATAQGANKSPQKSPPLASVFTIKDPNSRPHMVIYTIALKVNKTQKASVEFRRVVKEFMKEIHTCDNTAIFYMMKKERKDKFLHSKNFKIYQNASLRLKNILIGSTHSLSQVWFGLQLNLVSLLIRKLCWMI